MRFHRASDARDHEFAGASALLHRKVEKLIEERSRLLLRDRLVLRAHLVGDMRDDLGLAHRVCHRVVFSSV